MVVPQIGIHLGTGVVSVIINAAIGAVLLLLVVRILTGGEAEAALLVRRHLTATTQLSCGVMRFVTSWENPAKTNSIVSRTVANEI